MNHDGGRGTIIGSDITENFFKGAIAWQEGLDLWWERQRIQFLVHVNLLSRKVHGDRACGRPASTRVLSRINYESGLPQFILANS